MPPIFSYILRPDPAGGGPTGQPGLVRRDQPCWPQSEQGSQFALFVEYQYAPGAKLISASRSPAQQGQPRSGADGSIAP